MGKDYCIVDDLTDITFQILGYVVRIMDGPFTRDKYMYGYKTP